MKTKDTNEFIVYAQWIAVELRKQGFKIIRVDVNEKKPQYDTYVFEDTSDFQKAFAAIVTK